VVGVLDLRVMKVNVLSSERVTNLHFTTCPHHLVNVWCGKLGFASLLLDVYDLQIVTTRTFGSHS
jgi:hypothetical protein